MRPRGAKYDDYPSPLPPFLRYGDDHYRAATWRKVTVVEKIVDWGFNVMHSDVDVVWFRDPLPYFLGEPCKDIDVALSTGEAPRGGKDGRVGATRAWRCIRASALTSSHTVPPPPLSVTPLRPDQHQQCQGRRGPGGGGPSEH